MIKPKRGVGGSRIMPYRGLVISYMSVEAKSTRAVGGARVHQAHFHNLTVAPLMRCNVKSWGRTERRRAIIPLWLQSPPFFPSINNEIDGGHATPPRQKPTPRMEGRANIRLWPSTWWEEGLVLAGVVLSARVKRAGGRRRCGCVTSGRRKG